jgi:glutaredoxin
MIEIWSKPNCPFCDKAENLCIQRKLEFKKYMLDVDYSREELFKKFPSARTFPQITIDGNLVGGYTEFAAKILED